LHFDAKGRKPENATAYSGSLSHRLQAEKLPQINQEDFMTSLALLLYSGPFGLEGTGQWIFLSIGAICLFAIFLPTVTWIDKQHKEREAFYKAETIRRVAEASGEGAKAALELLKAQSRMESLKKREGMKIGGLICIAVGVAMVIFLRVVAGADPDNPYLVGLIPAFVGVALLVYVYLMAAPLE
jgi:DNA integrity scanning protein DisA with diadenylate cyclase activity